jgi:hypothetical protein
VVSLSDTQITRSLAVSGTSPEIQIKKAASGQNNAIYGFTASAARWSVSVGNVTAETGGNTGSNFNIDRFNDAGGFIDTAFAIDRSAGLITMPGRSVPVAANAATLKMGYAHASGDIGITLKTNSDATAYAIAFFNAASSSVGYITTTATTTAYSTSSDGRLKEDARELSTAEVGTIIDGTEVYDFKWKETGERAFGIIAQQAAPVYATPITHDETSDRYFVDYSKYIPVVLRELQALRKRVAELEGKLTEKPT